MLAPQTLERHTPPIGGSVNHKNRMLAALSHCELRPLQPYFELVPLVRGRVLYEADDSVTRAYFPVSGIVSLVSQLEDGSSVELAAVGREGMIGIEPFFGGEGGALSTYLVQVPGSALAIDTSRLRPALDQNSNLQAACTSYGRALLAQVVQSAACSALHGAEARCVRWLLMAHDRSDGDTFPLTQEFLAEILGVRRATVTVIAGALQAGGLIRYHRGAVTVVDRRGLEAAACECYGTIRSRYEEALPHAFGIEAPTGQV